MLVCSSLGLKKQRFSVLREIFCVENITPRQRKLLAKIKTFRKKQKQNKNK
jgi:hypothetical protein